MTKIMSTNPQMCEFLKGKEEEFLFFFFGLFVENFEIYTWITVTNVRNSLPINNTMPNRAGDLFALRITPRETSESILIVHTRCIQFVNTTTFRFLFAKVLFRKYVQISYSPNTHIYLEGRKVF